MYLIWVQKINTIHLLIISVKSIVNWDWCVLLPEEIRPIVFCCIWWCLKCEFIYSLCFDLLFLFYALWVFCLLWFVLKFCPKKQLQQEDMNTSLKKTLDFIARKIYLGNGSGGIRFTHHSRQLSDLLAKVCLACGIDAAFKTCDATDLHFSVWNHPQSDFSE